MKLKYHCQVTIKQNYHSWVKLKQNYYKSMMIQNIKLQRALTQLSDLSIDYRSSDTNEDHIVSRFMYVGCGYVCKCHLNFSTDYVSIFGFTVLSLHGQISAFTNKCTNVSDTSNTASIRKHSYSTYYHQTRQLYRHRAKNPSLQG